MKKLLTVLLLVAATNANAGFWSDAGDAFDPDKNGTNDALNEIGQNLYDIITFDNGGEDYHGQTGCGSKDDPDNYGYADCDTNPPVDTTWSGPNS